MKQMNTNYESRLNSKLIALIAAFYSALTLEIHDYVEKFRSSWLQIGDCNRSRYVPIILVAKLHLVKQWITCHTRNRSAVMQGAVYEGFKVYKRKDFFSTWILGFIVRLTITIFNTLLVYQWRQNLRISAFHSMYAFVLS